MNADHSGSPELRRLLLLILDRLDPAVRAAAARAAEGSREPGACQQVWCPVCALVALINGEQHPLLDVVAEHSATLLTMLRAMATDPARASGPPESARDCEPPTRSGGYQDIPIVVEPADD